jgi:hypothetical protein
MQDLVDQVTEQFRARRHWGTPASVDAHFVTVYYENGDLLITGTGREMPPFLLFHGLPRERQIWISATGKGDDWVDVTDDSGGLAALALLDPRRVIEARTTNDVVRDSIEVDISELLRQTGVTEAAADAGGATQVVEFILENGTVTQMVQNDIAGSEEQVIIRFGTRAPSSLPPYDLPSLS